MISALLFAFALAQSPAGCVPARWPFSNPESLSLLENSPINCLVLDQQQWSGPFVEAARGRGILVLASVPADAEIDLARRAFSAGLMGLVVEGDAKPGALEAFGALANASHKPLVYLPSRSGILSNTAAGPVLGTGQALWPGIHAEKEDTLKAGPTAAPWIDTNFGFLQFLRAAVPSGSTLWIANRPPEKADLGPARFVQALGDAAISGAHWVLAFDSAYAAQLARKDDKAVAGWRRINDVLRFYHQHHDLCDLPDHALLAIVQDASSGGLLSGSFLDMIAPRHIPAVIVPAGKLPAAALPDISLLLNTDPASLTPEQKQKVMSIARRGATVVNGPPAWKLSMPPPGAITFDKDQYQKLDDILREINQLVGRRNLGVRLFNAPGTLSSLRAAPDGRKLVLHLVNYTAYPIESVTAEVLGKYKTASLLTPDGNHALKTYDTDDGTGVEIEKLGELGIVVFE